MINADEFRAGLFSVPSLDADMMPPFCFACTYLSYKEFSTPSDGPVYYFCAYTWSHDASRSAPPCLGETDVNS